MAQAMNPKIIKWAKESGNAQYLGNRELIQALYAENNKAKKIADVMDGMQAEMKMMIVKEDTRPIRLCAGCKSKSCKMDKCGQEDYQTFHSHTVLAGDQYNKVINLNFPPWYEGEIPEKNGQYLIKGKGRQVPVQNENQTPILELVDITVVRELKEGEFKIRAEASEDEESAGDDEATETEEESTDEETEDATEEAADEDEEEEKPAKKVVKPAEKPAAKPSKVTDPKLAKAIERVKQYFKVNDGARKPAQLQNFMKQQGIEKYYKDVVAKLSLEENDDGEFEYVE